MEGREGNGKAGRGGPTLLNINVGYGHA